MKCNTCANERYCYDGNHQLTRDGCADNGFAAYTPITNADRIRSMSDEELTKYVCCPHDQCIDLDAPCDKCVLSWLKSPAEEGDEK